MCCVKHACTIYRFNIEIESLAATSRTTDIIGSIVCFRTSNLLNYRLICDILFIQSAKVGGILNFLAAIELCCELNVDKYKQTGL